MVFVYTSISLGGTTLTFSLDIESFEFNEDVPNGANAVVGSDDKTGIVAGCFRILYNYYVVVLYDIPDDQVWAGSKGEDDNLLIFDNINDLNNAFSAHGLDPENYMFSNLQNKTLYRDIVVLTYQDIVDTVIPMGLTLDIM
jgi:hypothetical protein